jgi:hypothetical protein
MIIADIPPNEGSLAIVFQVPHSADQSGLSTTHLVKWGRLTNRTSGDVRSICRQSNSNSPAMLGLRAWRS